MEKRNTLLLTVIAVATLLVAVVGATFAYFASSIDLNNTTAEFTAEADPMSSAFVATGSAFSMHVTADKMQSVGAGAEVVAATAVDGKMEVKYASSVPGTPMYCTYNIYWDWDDADGASYLAHSPLVKDGSELYAGKEFTIDVDFNSTVAVADGQNAVTKNLLENEIDWTDVTKSNAKILVASAKIWSNQTTDTIHTWTYTSKFYNVVAYQNALAGRTYKGVFTVEDVVC